MLLKHERIDGQLCTPVALSFIFDKARRGALHAWIRRVVLVQLLEDMRRAAEAFGRSEIEGLFDASDAPSYEGELRDFLVESMWRNVGDVDVGADRLRARQIKEDIKGLRDATEDVKRYADLVVAHNAREKPAPVAFSVISSATDEIVRIAKRYTAALAGASMLSFALVDQFNWYDVFHFPWIAPSEA